ncbi:MAG: polysaccharide deacetylase family protein, partial [Erysipelotrichaceae bacterium]|nr:polysaccharide deacetylase family protein [Erysipelotrichaceae bacterium]
MAVRKQKPKKRKIRIGRLLILLIPAVLLVGGVAGILVMVSSILHNSSSGEAVAVKKYERTVPLKRAAPEDTGKTVYLTFDDGCSGQTDQILDTLEAYDAKATFFVINGQNNEKLKKIQERGHSIGLHSYSHNYDQIYSSEDAYFSDLNQISDVVYEQTGMRPDIIRFPG